MAHPKLQTTRHLRRTKLFGAFAVSALAGIGSYSATYYVFARISEPVGVVGVAAPPVTQGHGQAHIMAPPTAQPTP